MTQRSLASGVAVPRPGEGEMPTPDIVAFIRYCHGRRGASWPELYDEMCDHAQLAARGVSFTLLEMPQLAGWARAVLAGMAEQREIDGSTTPRLEAQAAVA